MSSEQLPEAALRSAIEVLAGALPDLTVEGTRRLRSLARQAAHLGDRDLEATASYHLGRALIESGDYEQAAESLERARALQQESDNQIEALRVSLGDIALAALTGRAREAIRHGREAIEELDRIVAADVDGEEREAANDLAALVRSNLVIPLVSVGEFDEALKCSDASLEHAEASSPAHRAIAYSNRGHLLIEMGRPASGLPWTERAASLFEDSDSQVRAARSHARSARAHALLGNYGTSLRRLRRAREDLAGLPGAADHLSIEVDMARVYATIGREHDALQLLHAAVPLMSGRSTLNDRATGLQLQAELTAEDQPAHARRLIKEAHDLLQSGGHHRDAALALLALGEILPSTTAADHSLLREAFVLLDDVGTVIDRVRWRVVAVENDLLDGEARMEAIAAAEDLERGISAPQLQWRLALQRGLAEVARGDLEAAKGALHRSSDILHALRSNIRDEWLRTRFLAGRRKAIDSLGAVLLDLGLTDELLELLDGAHGITLTERLQNGGRERARETSAELSVLYDELLSADKRRLRAIQPRIRELQDEMAFGDSASLRIGTTEPESGESSRTQSVAAGHSRPVATPPGATLVAYGERDDEIYAIVSAPDSPARIVRHVAGVEWLRDARTSLALLQRRAMTPALAPHRPRMVELMRATMQDLHDGLIRPLGLPLARGSDRLVVVPPPSGVDVPFAALHDGSVHLIERATITLTSSPSVATEVMSRHERLDTARTHPDGPRTLAIGVGAGGAPASVLEAAEIAHRSAGTLLSGPDATADNVRELIADHDIVHLASHALSRTADPWFSGLQLSDRWVTAAEISGWRLDDQLIVLSGCDTGLQTTYEHRGANMSLELLGLPRAFLAAGAGGVIATLSDIDDTDAVRFMRPLHDNLREHPPDVALRRTQRSFLVDPGSLPAWSTTACIGGPSIALP